MRLDDPAKFIKADWIRPEDLAYYEELGVDSIKLVNRGMRTENLVRIVEAYTQRRYEGNLLDLLPSASKNINFSRKNYFQLFKYFFHPGLVNIFKLFALQKAFGELPIYIDNRKLEGFLVSLQKQNCSSRLCEDCGFCKDVARRAIKYEDKEIDKMKAGVESIFEQFMRDDFFYYFK
jgi:collagenase-like PrtC family protease